MATIIAKAADYDAAQVRASDEPVYLRIRFGADGSYCFGSIYCDVPANDAANEEFFGEAKGRFVLEDGSKIEVSGTQASLIAKAKHAYERCRGESKALSFIDAAWTAFEAAKPENASEWWTEYAKRNPLTTDQLAQVQAKFDAYSGPSGKRVAKPKTFSQEEIAAAVARHGGDFMKAAAELGILK